MSVASRIFSILRRQALSTSRALLERARGGRSFVDPKDARPAPEQGSESGRSKSRGPYRNSATEGVGGSSEGAGSEEPARPDPNLATYYANLEIPYGAGIEAVEVAWKRQARRYHPDRHASDPTRHAVATELLQGINHAYSELRRHLASSKR